MAFVRCASKQFTVFDNAEYLAEEMHKIAHWAKSHPNSQKFTVGILKLPPVFASNENSKKNLVAMIKTLAEYEDGYGDGTFPTLQELPQRYNHHGGTPSLSDKDMRRVHNWLQQVSFGLRAALVNEAAKNVRTASKKEDAVNEVYNKLYATNERRAFVTYSPDNKYELKPLRHATDTAKKNWILQEIDQRLSNEEFGAKPNYVEWEVYGLRGHGRNSCAAITEELNLLIRQAQAFDAEGKYEEADRLDAKLNQCYNELSIMERLDANWSF